jgi:formate dehydrogenase iron-sulfur subunit
MQKCTFCADRLINGQPPACAEACPTGAITFGNRDELVTAGRERTSELKSSYPNAVLYGENELGGLHVMYVLKDLPASYALSPEPKVPDAVMVKDVIKPLGWAVIGLAVLGLTFNYLVAQARTRNEKEG